MTNPTYGAGPPPLRARVPREGATLKEIADWIAYLRADGAPDDAPVHVVTNLRTGIKRAKVPTGDQLEKALQRRARHLSDTTSTTPNQRGRQVP